MKLDPFYLIVDSAAWIERLVPVGVRLVQLRIKTRDETGLRAEIRKAKAL
ncbi:MAG: thiamine phosphate synthase, partial [Mesorhizobium sp.]